MNSLPSKTKALIGVSFREFARYALPSIIGMLIVGLQTIIDGLFVGRGVVHWVLPPSTSPCRSSARC